MILQVLYLCSAVLFILSIKGLSSPQTAQRGNRLGMAGMTLAILTTMASHFHTRLLGVLAALVCGGGVGFIVARKVKMTALPQLMAAFHSLVGAAAVLVALATLLSPQAFHLGVRGALPRSVLTEIGLGVMIGALTLTGSVIAFLKLQGRAPKCPFKPRQARSINASLGLFCSVLLAMFVGTESTWLLSGLVVAALLVGVTLILPIGGADMPVIVSMLNSYSGWAAAATGFTLQNPLLIITGALVGASGAILSSVMCKNMNRSLVSIILGGAAQENPSTTSSGGGSVSPSVGGATSQRPVKLGSVEDAAFVLSQARSVIIVPGYGMAVAQAQRVLGEMAQQLKQKGIQVRYAIHPVAGRMPGHMNVLLAEADVPYDDVFELDDINADFGATDVAFVIGANDITNPAAHDDPSSPIYGMPVLDVEKAGTILFVKRSLGTGYAGVDNTLFYRENTLMILGDAKKVCEDVIKSLKAV